MKDKSGSAALLDLARRALRQQLLEHIPPEDKYTALMVANTMAIVARQIERGEATQDDEADRKLSDDIRAAKVAPGSPEYDKVYELLCDQARQKVLISNPGYLEQ